MNLPTEERLIGEVRLVLLARRLAETLLALDERHKYVEGEWKLRSQVLASLTWARHAGLLP